MKVALVQSSIIWGNIEVNLERFDQKLMEITGCDLIILPELFASGSLMVRKELSEGMEEKIKAAAYYSRIHKKMQQWAEYSHALIMGSAVCEDEGKYYNRMIVAFPDGNCLYYDKRHCFSLSGENEHFSAGKELLVFDFRGFRIAAFICYDLRFPVWSRNTQDYDLAVYVANWPASRRHVWKTLLKARAIENQCFVAGVNCVGKDNANLEYAGDSVFLCYKGNEITDCLSEEKVIFAEPDLEGLRAFRRKFPALNDRDIFSINVSTNK